MSTLIPLINHIIRQNRETQTALAGFFGKTVLLALPGIHVTGTFDRQGFLACTGRAPDAEIRFQQRAVQKVLQGQTPGAGDVQINGDAGLAAALLPLFGSLRYDAGDDLSRLFGDAAAGSIALRAEKANRAFKNIGLSILEQLGDFAREPEAPVVGKAALAEWFGAVDTLRDDAARLEARLEKLERRQSAANADAGGKSS